MLKIRIFLASLCLILGMCSEYAFAQSSSQDADDWDQLRGRRNIFALRNELETNLPVSDGVRALGVAYIGAFSRDFDTANENLGFARNYATARGDDAFGEAVDNVEQILMREQGRYQALSARLERSAQAGSTWQRMVAFRAAALTSAYIGVQEFSLQNISPDDARIIVPAQLGGVAGTLLFDSGAESSLLSGHYAQRYGAEPAGVNYSMLTADGPRTTELARLSSLELGAARFGNVSLGVQTQTNGVIGFFLNEGATGILGFPIISRFGAVDFKVVGTRVEKVVLRRPIAGRRAPEKPNMMIREDKPYIKVTLEGETYSCIFDTGAPRSVFSSTIIARHEAGLSLEALSRRDTKKAGLLWGDGAGVRYIADLPMRAGHREISLQNVQMIEGGGPASDFCVVGLDAVISSGGARMDMTNLQISFGVNNSLTSRVFNLH